MNKKQLKEAMNTRPRNVALVALGPSFIEFMKEQIHMKNMPPRFDEVWVVNRGSRALIHDKVFAMDDLQWLNERDEHYGRYLQNHNRPIITSTPYPEFPSAVAYPIKEVMDLVGDDLFNNGCVYMVGYAMLIGVETLFIYGADFSYPNMQAAEEGGQAMGYILGMARARGVQIRIPQSSTLLSSNISQLQEDGTMRRPLYGYHRKEEIHIEQSGIFGSGPTSITHTPDGVGPKIDHNLAVVQGRAAQAKPNEIPDDMEIAGPMTIQKVKPKDPFSMRRYAQPIRKKRGKKK
jgi:hypothetical protein|tara:strand:+ start:963 stop:1835 length:873 start_codon:yes stop_codon:yes gene_type:complete